MKIKYDLSDSDGSEAFKGGESPKPGVYGAKVKECKLGYRKGSDGKPDKDAPRLEVTLEIQDKPYKGSLLWDYLTFTKASQWKLDQFLQAVGVAGEKNKRKGELDPDKVVGKKIKIRVKADSNQAGEYRGKVGAYLKSGDDGDDEGSEDEDFDVPEEKPKKDKKSKKDKKDK